MITLTTEQAQQIEEALEELHYSSGTVKAVTLYKSALAAIREELAEQDKQEPVAWRWKNGNEWLNKYTYLDNGAPDCPELCEPLYAAPVYTKDLTDDEAQKLWNDTSSIVPMWAHHLHFARAVIAADREKNK